MDVKLVATDVAVLGADEGDEWLDVSSLHNAVAQLPGEVTSIVITRGNEAESTDRMITHAREGLTAVRAVPGTDAVKRIEGGLVTATLDRSRIVRVRLPVACPRALIAEVLAAADTERRRVHLTDLADLANTLIFVDDRGALLR